MKAAYFDSSVLLAILLEEESAADALDLWESYAIISSVLMEADAMNTLRRASRTFRKGGAEWLALKQAYLDELLMETTLKSLDQEILDELRGEPTLSLTRTMDALHLATALFFRKQSDEAIALVTFDLRMRETALALGFNVLPES